VILESLYYWFRGSIVKAGPETIARQDTGETYRRVSFEGKDLSGFVPESELAPACYVEV
jgi:hypothetical protein